MFTRHSQGNTHLNTTLKLREKLEVNLFSTFLTILDINPTVILPTLNILMILTQFLSCNNTSNRCNRVNWIATIWILTIPKNYSYLSNVKNQNNGSIRSPLRLLSHKGISKNLHHGKYSINFVICYVIKPCNTYSIPAVWCLSVDKIHHESLLVSQFLENPINTTDLEILSLHHYYSSSQKTDGDLHTPSIQTSKCKCVP